MEQSYWTLANEPTSSGRFSLLTGQDGRPFKFDNAPDAYRQAVLLYAQDESTANIAILHIVVETILDYQKEGKALAEEYRASQEAKAREADSKPAPKPAPAHVGYVHVPWGQFPVTRKQADALIAQRMINQTGTNHGGIIYHPHNTRTFVEVKLAMEALGVVKEGE